MDSNDWNDAERLVERAHELFEQRKWQEALDELVKATHINPYNGGWFFNIGLTLDELDRREEAVVAYQKALEFEPDDVQGLLRLGADLHELGRFEDALVAFERIEQIDCTFESAYCSRILTYTELGRHDRAEEMFYLARLYKDECPTCYYNMGCSLAARGLYDRAIFCWNKTLDAQGEAGGPHPEVHLRIAEALWNKGELEQSRRHYVAGLRQDPGNIATLLDLSELLADMHRWDEAGEKIRRAIELSPDDPAAHFCQGRWLMRSGKDSAAIESLRRALQLDPTYPGAHARLGELYLRSGRTAAGREQLRAELLLRPQEPGLLKDLGNLLIDAEELRAATACLKRLTQVAPKQADAWLNLGVAPFLRRRYAEGVEACHQCLRVDAGNTRARFNLALAAAHCRDYDVALEHVRLGLKRTSHDPALRQLELRLRLGRIRHRFVGAILRMIRLPMVMVGR
jgi:tetratricopeptide (TPR) repeat protein